MTKSIEERIESLENAVACLTRTEELRNDLAVQINRKVEERLNLYKKYHS